MRELTVFGFTGNTSGSKIPLRRINPHDMIGSLHPLNTCPFSPQLLQYIAYSTAIEEFIRFLLLI